MSFSLNLYTNKKYDYLTVRNFLREKDPVIFILPQQPYDAIYHILNISDDLRKYLCLTQGFNISKATAFCASFDRIPYRRILVMSPYQGKEQAIRFTKQLIKNLNVITLSRGLRR